MSYCGVRLSVSTLQIYAYERINSFCFEYPGIKHRILYALLSHVLGVYTYTWNICLIFYSTNMTDTCNKSCWCQHAAKSIKISPIKPRRLYIWVFFKLQSKIIFIIILYDVCELECLREVLIWYRCSFLLHDSDNSFRFYYWVRLSFMDIARLLAPSAFYETYHAQAVMKYGCRQICKYTPTLFDDVRTYMNFHTYVWIMEHACR